MVYVTADVREEESHFQDLDDRDTVTRLAQALEASGVERLAVDQRPSQSGGRPKTRAVIERPKPTAEQLARLRSLQQERIALAETRRETERKLEQVKQDLKQTGRLGFRQRKDELRSEIARHEAALRFGEIRLSKLETQAAELREIVASASEVSRPPVRGRALASSAAGERQLAGLGLDR
jgi:hypothetical protein